MHTGEIVAFSILGLIMAFLYFNIYMLKRIDKKKKEKHEEDSNDVL